MGEKWENGNFCYRNLTVSRIYRLLSHLSDTNYSQIYQQEQEFSRFLPSDNPYYRMDTVILHKNHRGWVMDFVYFAQMKILCSTPNHQPPNHLTFSCPFLSLFHPFQTLHPTPLNCILIVQKIKIKNSKNNENNT